jgi:hypothetical protein
MGPERVTSPSLSNALAEPGAPTLGVGEGQCLSSSQEVDKSDRAGLPARSTSGLLGRYLRREPPGNSEREHWKGVVPTSD